METLVLDGKTYVKASKAARDLGYTSDYVGQLCRGGSVSAHLVGRTWYVDPTQLGEHRVEKKRNSRIKAREQVRKALEEKHLSLRTSSVSESIKSPAIQYEDDPADLLPVVKKISVTEDVSKPKRPSSEPKYRKEPAYEVENKGNKVIMSGTIVVTDAENETADESVTLLRPKIEKKQSEKTKVRARTNTAEEIAKNAHLPDVTTEEPELDNESQTQSEILDVEQQIHKKDFLTKLEELNAIPQELRDADSEISPEEHKVYAPQQPNENAEGIPLVKHIEVVGPKNSGSFLVFSIIVVALLVLASLTTLEGNWVITDGVLHVDYGININSAISKIMHKI